MRRRLLPVIEQPDVICLRLFGTSVKSVDELIESVFSSFQENYQDTQWLMEIATLATLIRRERYQCQNVSHGT